MNTLIRLTLVCLMFPLINGCNTNLEEHDEYVFAVQLVNDPVKIQEYLEYHKKVWPEVESCFKAAGYKSIRLYRFENYLTMIVEVPKGVSLEEIGKADELQTEKVKEWNALMDSYQKGLPGTNAGATWVAMGKYYEFNNNGQ